MSKKSGLNQRFLGLIVLPIAGNACEHITAIFVAVKNKMDLAIGVALGSSIQVGIDDSAPRKKTEEYPSETAQVLLRVLGDTSMGTVACAKRPANSLCPCVRRLRALCYLWWCW